MLTQIFAVRGATTVDADTAEDIIARSMELMSEMLGRNSITDDSDLEISDYLISTTDDVTAYYPARAIRENILADVPVFSMKEPSVVGALPRCIRIMLHVANHGEPVRPKHVYLHGAKALRRDLADD